MINRVVLVGRLTRDPELRYTTNNIAHLRFTVAVNRQFTNQEGVRQADFIGCVAWRSQAENMARFLKKGSLIGVDGRIETGSFQGQDGQMRYTTDVVADSVQFLEPRSAQGGGGGTQPGYSANDSYSRFPGSGASGQSNPFPTASGTGGQSNPFPTASGTGGQSNPFPTASGTGGQSNPFPTASGTGGQSNPFPSVNNDVESNSSSVKDDSSTNIPDVNPTIDISDDDLPF